MFNLVERRKTWFTISAIVILPGILFMIWQTITTGTPLPLNIDYTGGTLWEMRFQDSVEPAEIRVAFQEAGYPNATAFTVENDKTLQVKFENIDPDAKDLLISDISEQFGEFEERYYRSIGPAIGTEVSRAALIAVLVASIGILLYIAFAFRQVSHPFHYGTCAVIALVHDVLVTITFVAIMYFVAGWEVDALFLTAILTVIGFSVNDTIVVFDRIRENLKRHRGESFAKVADRSLLETYQRSIATQVTVLLVLMAILIFGGATLRQFMATMMVGMVSGTFSSLFNATPLLVAWEERSLFGKKTPAAPAAEGNAVPA
jgi:preprotein translocase subunit SecF